MLREYCPVIGASHAEGEASSSIAPWRLSASVQHHLIASSLLTSSDHASHHFLHPPPIFFSSFYSLPTLFIYPSYICSLFLFPTLCEEHPSPTPPLHLFPSFLSLKTSPSHTPVNFPDFLSFSLLLFAFSLQCSCGNSSIMPVVLWPWPGGQFLGPEGCCSSCLCKVGVLGSGLHWKDEQLEGWRPVGASRGHRGHSHSKPWLPAQRYGVKEDHASGAEKELLFPHGSQRTQPCSQPSRLSKTTTPSFSCHVITFSVFLCTATGIITFVLQHCNNIWCLFLINQAASVHISKAVASDI